VRILGLDPGSLHTGFGVVDKRGSSITAVDYGRISCPRKRTLPERIARLTEGLERVLAEHQPDRVALETPYHGLNARSLIVLAQARGALLAVIVRHSVEVSEYSPAEVKSAVTGHGRADKEQVARMVGMILSLRGTVPSADATDALAVAICCAQREKLDALAP
jgi:crossover junction endodeoxyribonuclease RuvC